MSKAFDLMIENGEIYRKRVCSRCGAVGYDKMKGWKKEDWRDPEAEFAISSFHAVPLPGWSQAVLCETCTAEVRRLIQNFMRPTRDAKEET